MMNGKANLKTIIVLVILLLVGVLSFLGMDAAKTYLSGAAAGTEPKSVLAAPGQDGKSVVITWSTDKPVQAVVEYGTTPASLLLRSLESDATAEHSLNIAPLKPATSYYFRIRVGDEVFDNSGIPYSFKTKGAVVTTPTAVPTLRPTLTPAVVNLPSGTAPTVGGGCNRTTDYNADGMVNSLDFIKCIKDGGKVAPVAPIVTVAPAASGATTETDCKPGVDYDANGVINTLDRIKCLQKKN